MLENIGKLGGLFGQQRGPQHPLASAKELRRILGELPMDNALKALDEIVGWLQSVVAADGMGEDVLFEVTCQLDEAAQWHELRLTREYLQSARLSKTDEKRLWSAVHGFWLHAAACYEKCVARLGAGDRPAENLRAGLPLLASRLIRALAMALKWQRFRYDTPADTVWLRLALAYSAAEQAGMATKAVQLYPKTSGMTSPQQEYLKVLALQASAVDSLLPWEIELAWRLVANYVGGFVFGPVSTAESVYWVDLARAQAPLRLASVPRQMVPTLRFFHPGRAYDNLQQLATELERGAAVPTTLALGNQYSTRALLPVLRHLAACWAPVPPQRRHARHAVKHRMSVLVGFPDALAACDGRPDPGRMESWVVENVSRGGFGIVVGGEAEEQLPLGTLLAMQPEGGDNWLLGVVRRLRKGGDEAVHVGIQTLSRQVAVVSLRPQAKGTSYAAAPGTAALWLQDVQEEGEVTMLVPPGTFDLRTAMEFTDAGRVAVLYPAILAGEAGDHEVARFRRPG